MNKYELILYKPTRVVEFGSFDSYDKLVQEIIKFIKIDGFSETTERFVMTHNNEKIIVNPVQAADGGYSFYTTSV